MRFLLLLCSMMVFSACTSDKPPEVPEGDNAVGSPSGNPTATPSGTAPVPTTSATTDSPPTCNGVTCAPGQTCISYYGIAGPRGPMFHECGIKCKRGERNDGCPDGTRCVTVADGPGDVCR